MKSIRIPKFFLIAVLLLLAGVFGTSTVLAANTDTWVGNTDSNFSTSNNWSYVAGPGPVATGDSLIFAASGSTTPTNDETSFSFPNITFSSGALAYTIGGNPFTNGTTTAGTVITVSSANNQIINNNITLAGNVVQTINAVSGNLTLGGTVNGAGAASGLAVAPATTTKTVTIANATFTGNLTVGAATFTAAAGALTINGGTFGSSTSTLTLANNNVANSFIMGGGAATFGTVNIGTAANETGASILINAGTATLLNVNIGLGGTGSSPANTGGALTLAGGTETLGTVNSFRDGGVGFVVNGTAAVTATNVDISVFNGASTGNAVMSISGGGSLTIVGASGGFKIGDPNNSNSSGANTHTATMNMSGGTLIYTNNTDGLLMEATAGGSSKPQAANVNISGGTAFLKGITVDAANYAQATCALNISGSATVVYLGSVGLAFGTAGTRTATFAGTSTIGAYENWSSSAPISLTGTPVTFQAADSSAVAHNITLSGILSGAGSLTKTGGGKLTLSAANTYTGNTTINAGTVTANFAENAGTAGPLGNPATPANSIVFGGGTLQFSAANTFDYSPRFSTAASQPISIDTGGQTVTFATTLTSTGGTLTKTGNGTLSLTAPNTYDAGTTISGGTLAVNNTTGSGTGGGTVTAGGGGLLGGTGTVSGAVILNSGGGVAPGNSVGTLTVSTLTMSAGATNNFEFNTTPANDQVTVSTASGLTVNGGTFNLYQEGGTTPFTTPGTYTLINYTGTDPGLDSTWTTASASNPHIANPQIGFNYQFSAGSGVLTVTIASAGTPGVAGSWSADGSGNWSDASKWTGGNVPGANTGVSADTATFAGITTTAPWTVTLNANEAIGSLTMNQNNSFTIANAGNTLTLTNRGFTSAVTVSAGTANAIQTKVALADNATVAVSSGKSLNISGVVVNGPGVTKTLTLSGVGTTVLGNANTYGPASSGTVGTTVSGSGTLQVGNNSALGAGDVTNTASSTLQAGAAGLSLTNNFGISSGLTTTVDNNTFDLTLSGVISGAGGLAKISSGKLTLGGGNTFSGGTTISAGTVSISADNNVGAVPGSATPNNINLNGGDLLASTSLTLNANRGIGIGATSGSTPGTALIDAASGQTLTVAGIIASAGNSGANNLTVNSGPGSTGTVALSGVNNMTGTTTISAGTLQLANALALQNSTLSYDTGSLTFNGITTATLAGLAGATSSQNLGLANTGSAAVTLTVNSIATNIYGGQLSGIGSLSKLGSGMQTISNATYTGDTTVGGSGNLTILGGSFGSPTNNITVANGGGAATLTISGGTATATNVNVATAANSTGAGMTIDGNASVYFTNSAFGAGGNTLGNVTINTTGNVGLGVTTIGKDGGVGLVISNGTVTATSVDVQGAGTAGTGNANMSISGGSLTIGNASSTNAFRVGDSTGGTGHGGNLTVNGGTLTYLGTDGLLAVNTNTAATTPHGNVTITGGIVKLTGVTLNAGNITNATSTLTVSGGATLYLGSVGLGVGANGTTTTATVGTGGATIGALANWSSVEPITLNDVATFQAADDSAVQYNITLGGVLSGAGGLTKTGNGTLTLSAPNTYTGSTTVSNGTLLVNGSSTDASVLVLTNGTLGGSGTIASAVTIQGGTLAPGAGLNLAGTVLTINNTLTLQAGSTNIMRVTHNPSIGGRTNDQIVASGAITYGGTLTIVTNAGDTSTYQAGDNFALFSGTVSGSFTAIQPNPGPNLIWSNDVANPTNFIVVSSGVLTPPPVAGFKALTITNIFVTQSVTFTNTSTGDITNSTWTFGDGNAVTNTGVNVTNNVSNVYNTAGSYTVSLTVKGNGGQDSQTRTAYITVKPKVAIGKPVLSSGQLILSGTNGPANQTYRILSSTNVALPVINWVPVFTNTFAPDGSYSYTNSPLTNKATFFKLVSP